MSHVPCPCCEGGRLAPHCGRESTSCPQWDKCVDCGATVHHYRVMAKSGLRQHGHPWNSPVQPPDCKLCGPTWDPHLKGAKP